MTHTPAPWRLAKEPPKCGLTVTLYGFGPKTLGTIHTGSDEYMANARLIVAAPDLLASLKEAVHLFETYGLIANIRNGVEDKFAPGRWVSDARDAITKAGHAR